MGINDAAMKRENFVSLMWGVVGPIFLSALSGACSDKTVQDYQKQLVDECLGQLQPIAGTYHGVLNAVTDSAPLGGIAIELKPDVVSKQSSDGAGVDQRCTTKVTLTYQLPGSNPTSVTSDLGAYTPKSRFFQTSFAVFDETGKSHSIDLNGTTDGVTFQGSLESDGFSDFGAKFNVGKNAAPAVVAKRELSRRVTEVVTENQLYVANYVPDPAKPTESLRVEMTLESPSTSVNQTLLNLLYPNHAVTARLNFGLFKLNFLSKDTYLNDEKKVLQGTTVSGADTGTLLCARKNAGSKITYTCDVSSSSGVFRLNFLPLGVVAEE